MTGFATTALRWLTGSLGATLILAMLLAMAARCDGDRVTILGVPLGTECAYRRAFGTPCGACGLTRGWVALAHRDVDGARAMNPDTVATFTGALLYLVLAGVALVLRRNASSVRVLALVILVVAWSGVIAQNVRLQTWRALRSHSTARPR